MKRESKKEEAINIADVTKLYATYAEQQKEIDAKLKKYKEKILTYAQYNRSNFKGKSLELPNGVRVEKRETEKAIYDDQEIDLDWLESALDADFEKAISIKLDPKEIKKMSLSQTHFDLLEEIHYEVEVKQTLAVCITT